jgi:hypothetical protein
MLLVCRTNKKTKNGGSDFGTQKLWREQIEGHTKLMRMYYNNNLTYPEIYFHRHIWMSSKLFKHIVTEVMNYDRFFEQQRHATGEHGHTTYQKVTAALRMLAYYIPVNLVGEHLVMGESTAIMCVKRFLVAIVQALVEKRG